AAAGAVSLAEETGGVAIDNTNDLAGGVHQIAVESRVFYLLGFHPPPGKPPGSWRKLRVEVKRPGVTVRARRGYTLARESTPTASGPGRKDKGPAEAAARQALDSPHDAAGIPLRAMVYVLDPRPTGGARVLVATELDASALAL